jgi:hypothetical protein
MVDFHSQWVKEHQWEAVAGVYFGELHTELSLMDGH